MNETSLKKEVWIHFQNMQPVFFATCDKGQPKVRPVMLIYFDERFWVSTGTDAAKIKQIKANSKIEFCLLLQEEKNSGYIRGTGDAKIVQEMETKRLLASNIPFFKNYWKDANDPNFTLLEIIISDIEYMKPGVMKVEKFSL